jgi:hypothetical protein
MHLATRRLRTGSRGFGGCSAVERQRCRERSRSRRWWRRAQHVLLHRAAREAEAVLEAEETVRSLVTRVLWWAQDVARLDDVWGGRGQELAQQQDEAQVLHAPKVGAGPAAGTSPRLDYPARGRHTCRQRGPACSRQPCSTLTCTLLPPTPPTIATQIHLTVDAIPPPPPPLWPPTLRALRFTMAAGTFCASQSTTFAACATTTSTFCSSTRQSAPPPPPLPPPRCG